MIVEELGLEEVSLMIGTPPPRGDGVVEFSVFQPGGARRSVQVLEEGRWQFEQYGEPLAFEDLEAYRARRVRDRLTPELIGRYVGEFGIDLFDPAFYRPAEAVLVTFAHGLS